MEGGEQLMVLFVQQEQKESLDFQKYGVSFILGLHALVSSAEWMVVDYLHQKSGQDRNRNKFRVTLKNGIRKYHCYLCISQTHAASVGILCTPAMLRKSGPLSTT